MALHHLQFQSLHSPLIDLARKALPDDGGYVHIDLSPDYQRASVWTVEQQRNLVKSLMQGLPIGAVFVNERRYPQSWPVVDGKQRIETVLAFIGDRLSVPAAWFEGDEVEFQDDHLHTTWGGLTDLGRGLIENRWSVAQYRTRIPATAEQELYNRINYGGTPHEPLG